MVRSAVYGMDMPACMSVYVTHKCASGTTSNTCTSVHVAMLLTSSIALVCLGDHDPFTPYILCTCAGLCSVVIGILSSQREGVDSQHMGVCGCE